jgi:hypothetical protein
MVLPSPLDISYSSRLDFPRCRSRSLPHRQHESIAKTLPRGLQSPPLGPQRGRIGTLFSFFQLPLPVFQYSHGIRLSRLSRAESGMLHCLSSVRMVKFCRGCLALFLVGAFYLPSRRRKIRFVLETVLVACCRWFGEGRRGKRIL